MIFVDTNYFLRFLLADVDSQYTKAKELFKKGSTGGARLITSVVVFFEIYWVLTSFYGKNREVVVEILGDLLKMSFIKWEERERLEKSIEIYSKSNLDLEDSYNLCFAKEKKVQQMASFDKKLIKMFLV